MINRKFKSLDNPLLKPQIKKDLIIEEGLDTTSKKINFNENKIVIKYKKILSGIFIKFPAKKLMLPVVIFIVIGLMYSAFSFYSNKTKTNGGVVTDTKIESVSLTLVEKVRRLILLPDYAPEVFKVSNVETLKARQPFFEKAENDDTVLVYKNEVVLYRESINKIINLAPVIKNKSGATTIQNNI